MRKRILHISGTIRQLHDDMRRFHRTHHNNRGVPCIVKIDAQTITCGNEEHFWMTENRIRDGYLNGHEIDDYVGIFYPTEMIESRIRRVD